MVGGQKEIIRYESISKNFGRKIILDNVSFSINEGEIFGIVGMSGSGKSTILNLLIGFLDPEMGDIKFLSDLRNDLEANGVYLSAFQNRQYVKKVFGFAAQSPSFYEMLSCEENLDYFGCMNNISRSIRKTNTKILLELMGLNDSTKKLGSELSGGMQKRLDIACALVHDPKVLILDEPTSNLDPLLRKQMWELIKKINRSGTTIVIASHFIDEIESLCDKVIIVHEAKVKELGSPSEIKKIVPINDEILLETSPGSYNKVIKKLKDFSSIITHVKKTGNKLLVTTSKSEAALHKILHVLESCDEILLDLEINKSSISDVFEKLISGKINKK